jgi:formate/nitrite transporter
VNFRTTDTGRQLQISLSAKIFILFLIKGGFFMVNKDETTVAAAEPALSNTPANIAKSAANAAIGKASLATHALILLAVLAGAYIAMGGLLNTVVTNDLAGFLGDGLSRLVGGAVFSLGLIMVVIGGAELFTGNNMVMTIGYLDRKITAGQVLRNWVLVYIFNFAGALIVALLVYFSGIWKFNGGAVGIKAAGIAGGKVSLAFSEALVRGILCNWLVCLAVWLSMAGKDVISKIAGIIFPVTAFVALGFEHSIANMYFIPMGILLKGETAITSVLDPSVLGNLTWSGFLLKNLLPVTIGNMIGGIIFVGTAYWNAYLRPKTPKSKGSGLSHGQ